MPSFYGNYINLVAEDHLFEALTASLKSLETLDKALLMRVADLRYAAGKWSVKDIFQHLIDCERILSYRALRFARNDQSSLASFEEDDYVIEAESASREIEDILAELICLRQSTMLMYKSFPLHTLQRSGICLNQSMSVNALGFTIVGHQLHHLKVLEERYFSL